LSDPTPPAQIPPGRAPRKPWWRLDRRDVIVLALLAVIAGWSQWPRQPPGPVQLLHRGTVGETGWSVLAQRTGSGGACLQVRVGGARRALMCDQHWDRDVYRLWRGAPPRSAEPTIGPPSLLRVRFPGTDQMLVVSVLYDEIATLTAPPGAGTDEVILHTVPLFDTEFHYVVAVLAIAAAAPIIGACSSSSGADGSSVLCVVSGGEVVEVGAAVGRLRTRPGHVLADKAYSSKAIRSHLRRSSPWSWVRRSTR
jgi:hypothetical protein